MPRSRTAPSPPAPTAVPPRAPGPSAPAALPPWRGRPAAGAGRTRRHSRCQRRYILPEPLPPPSSRHAGHAGLGLSVTEHRPGGRAGLSSGPLPRRLIASRAGCGPGSGPRYRPPVLRLIKGAKGTVYGCNTIAPRYSPFLKGS